MPLEKPPRRHAVRCTALVGALGLFGCGAPAEPSASPAAAPARAGDETHAAVARGGLLDERGTSDSERAGEPPRSPTDLSTCALVPSILELGAPSDGEPSAPVAIAGGFLVAFTRYDPAGASHLYLQRAALDGTLGEPVLLRSGVHASRPLLVAFEGRAYVAAIAADGTAQIIVADEAHGGLGSGVPIGLSAPPEDLAFGPRGLVSTHTDGARRVVRRHDGRPDVELAGPESWPEPREQILVSGADVDAVLVRHGAQASFVALGASDGPGGPAPVPLFSGSSPVWTEASIAAGASGFLVVRTGPGIGDLEVHVADRGGVVAPGPVSIPAPLASARAPDALVRRYPRAAALGTGWVLSYWDGVGPSLVRIGATGAVTADAIELRSGDERGGHTDARMATTSDAIAVTWQVGPPARSHGFPEEEPRRPGPRLAILRCARAP